MQFNKFTDQIVFGIIKKEVIEKTSEITDAKREDISDIEIDTIKDFGELNPIIKRFIENFSKAFTEEQTKRMLKKLNTLEIEIIQSTTKLLDTSICLGSYNSLNNKITLNQYNDSNIPFNLEKTLIHELLHMASTNNTDVGLITGIEVPELLGVRFNEFYTDYLAERYFYNNNSYIDNADNSLLVVKGIESLVGKEKLQECYFESNIGKLINEIEPYSTKLDILKLFYVIEKMDNPYFSRKDFRTIIREIANMNFKRLDILFNNKELTQEEYDIENARIREFKNFSLWTEDAEVSKDEDCFIFKEGNRNSELYSFTKTKENNPQFEKKH